MIAAYLLTAHVGATLVTLLAFAGALLAGVFIGYVLEHSRGMSEVPEPDDDDEPNRRRILR